MGGGPKTTCANKLIFLSLVTSTWLIKICITVVQKDAWSFLADFFFFNQTCKPAIYVIKIYMYIFFSQPDFHIIIQKVIGRQFAFKK